MNRNVESIRKVSGFYAQPPYNLFERQIKETFLPDCLAYGAICRGLLSGRMNPDSRFEGDDLRQTDPKFRPSRFGQYLEAVALLDQFARKNYGERVIHVALRWVLDQPASPARYGAHDNRASSIRLAT